MIAIGNDSDILNAILWNNGKEELFNLSLKNISKQKKAATLKPLSPQPLLQPLGEPEGTQEGDQQAAGCPLPLTTEAAPKGAPWGNSGEEGTRYWSQIAKVHLKGMTLVSPDLFLPCVEKC